MNFGIHQVILGFGFITLRRSCKLVNGDVACLLKGINLTQTALGSNSAKLKKYIFKPGYHMRIATVACHRSYAILQDVATK